MILSPGQTYGHMILIECALNKPFRIVDNVKTHRKGLLINYPMKGAHTPLLVWNESGWVQVAYSVNH